MTTANKKVLVHGQFDVLNHETIRFLEEASKFGDLYVCVEHGQNEKDSLYMIGSIKYVKDLRISNDFQSALDEIKPSIFYIDQHDETKKEIVTLSDIEYIVHSNVNDSDEKEQMSEIAKLKSDNIKLRKLCKALNEMNNSLKIEMNKSVKALTAQNIKTQKDLISAFGVIAKLKEMIDENEQNQNEADEEEEEEEEEEMDNGNVCVLCYAVVEMEDLIKLNECEHTFCAQCVFNSILADISMYERTPICGMCDAEGKKISIPEDICKAVIQKYDESMLVKYQNILVAK